MQRVTATSDQWRKIVHRAKQYFRNHMYLLRNANQNQQNIQEAKLLNKTIHHVNCYMTQHSLVYENYQQYTNELVYILGLYMDEETSKQKYTHTSIDVLDIFIGYPLCEADEQFVFDEISVDFIGNLLSEEIQIHSVSPDQLRSVFDEQYFLALQNEQIIEDAPRIVKFIDQQIQLYSQSTQKETIQLILHCLVRFTECFKNTLSKNAINFINQPLCKTATNRIAVNLVKLLKTDLYVKFALENLIQCSLLTQSTKLELNELLINNPELMVQIRLSLGIQTEDDKMFTTKAFVTDKAKQEFKTKPRYVQYMKTFKFQPSEPTLYTLNDSVLSDDERVTTERKNSFSISKSSLQSNPQNTPIQQTPKCKSLQRQPSLYFSEKRFIEEHHTINRKSSNTLLKSKLNIQQMHQIQQIDAHLIKIKNQFRLTKNQKQNLANLLNSSPVLYHMNDDLRNRTVIAALKILNEFTETAVPWLVQSAQIDFVPSESQYQTIVKYLGYKKVETVATVDLGFVARQWKQKLLDFGVK
ncbi:Hypothetical_protein [Hexamita inflata]|uniref:Hypothetical_protein n=1 Tax=Hexamita inflata TaxID=28002 RepID=A0AA86PBQ7_9EUKA|nr:Hypothetical protein HINF_LOCUS22223 [Hexamita inflata]